MMSHLRPTLKHRDRVCRTDDPRHVGIIIARFRWARHSEWYANVRWEDNGWAEYVPMSQLVRAED
jgi:hypothetical protein